MINAAQGVETEEVKHYYDIRIPKSVSNGTTTPRDIKTLDEAKIVIYALADMVALRLRSYNLVANGIGLSIKIQLYNGRQNKFRFHRQAQIRAQSQNPR